MGLFNAKKIAIHPCPKCGKPTPHEKMGADYDLQLPLVFLTCLLWLPVLILSAFRDKRVPFRCVACGSQVLPRDMKEVPGPSS